MIKELLTQEEGKTLEFKESTQSLQKIVQTIVAFANTAGGTLVIGVKDKVKQVIGLENILQDEERIANAIADSIAPQIFPSFQLHTWRNRDLLIITVPHSFGPYYIKSNGLANGVYMRLGSTNRVADQQAIDEIKRLRSNIHFDEQPNFSCTLESINFDRAKKLFDNVSKKFTTQNARSLGLITQQQSKELPSNGAVLLFADNLKNYFPDACIRLGRFLGTNKSEVLDHLDLEIPLILAIDQITAFIRRNTSMAAEIKEAQRKNIPQYPAVVIREAVTNAILHADYSIKGASIQVAIFDDRLEISNPGGLPLGLDMKSALAGMSQLRNRVIGRIFRELNLIEQWGSGLGRMIEVCEQHGIQPPKIEELGGFFRVTLYHQKSKKNTLSRSQPPQRNKSISLNTNDKQAELVINYLKKHKTISPKQAQVLWAVTARTTSSRLKKMCEAGTIAEIATSPFDPQKLFSLRTH